MFATRAFPLFALAATLAAQQNPFVVFPQDPERQGITAASYVRRPNWNSAAEGLQQLSADWFRGIGDTTGACAARGFYYWAADENLSTSETYDIVLRTADPSGAPDVTAGGLLLQVTGLATPTNAAGGRGSWIMIDGFATPVAVPCEQSWYQGIGLPANPLWPATDGLSMWAADALVPATPPTTGENHRLGAPNVTWSADPVLGTSVSRPWTCIFGVFVDSPVLHLGGIDPLSSRTGTLGASSYGMNGLFPDIPAHGLDARVQDNVSPQGIAVLAVAFAHSTPPLPFGFGGRYYLDLTSTATVGFAVLSNGAGTIPIAMPGTLPAWAVGLSLYFQGIVFDFATGAGRFTNTQASSF